MGHWRELASFSQSTPRHVRFVGGSSAMVARVFGFLRNGSPLQVAKSADIRTSRRVVFRCPRIDRQVRVGGAEVGF